MPTPSSVRQDELTSLETEAQVARSAEVLDAVAAQGTDLTTRQLETPVQVVVPPNTQILEISYSSTDPVVAQQVADAVAAAYLDNRARRFDDVNSARIDRVETQTAGRGEGPPRGHRRPRRWARRPSACFQSELADALRNELVSLRAQRTALENSEAPAGAVISPASKPAAAGGLTTTVMRRSAARWPGSRSGAWSPCFSNGSGE